MRSLWNITAATTLALACGDARDIDHTEAAGGFDGAASSADDGSDGGEDAGDDGEDGDDGDAPPPDIGEERPPDDEVPSSNPYCTPVADWDPESSALEERVVELTNQHRLAGGTCAGEIMPPTHELTLRPSLRCAARVHSMDMHARGFVDHVNPDGDTWYDRIAFAGYYYSRAGENIRSGSATAEEAVQAWLDSPGHCVNLFRADYYDIGVGHYRGGDHGHLWTQNLAAH
jgi:uncharacterized protein YkwD